MPRPPALVVDDYASMRSVVIEVLKRAGFTEIHQAGNGQLALAKVLHPGPSVVVLDEPTRGVDVGAKYEIYKLMLALADRGVAIIMVSSELAEVLGVSDRVLVMGEGRLRGDFINDGLSQETVLAAALDQRPAPAANTANKESAT